MKRVKIRFNSSAAIGKVLRFDDNIEFLALLRLIIRKLLGTNQPSNDDISQFRLMLGNDVEVDDTSDIDDGDDLVLKQLGSGQSRATQLSLEPSGLVGQKISSLPTPTQSGELSIEGTPMQELQMDTNGTGARILKELCPNGGKTDESVISSLSEDGNRNHGGAFFVGAPSDTSSLGVERKIDHLNGPKKETPVVTPEKAAYNTRTHSSLNHTSNVSETDPMSKRIHGEKDKASPCDQTSKWKAPMDVKQELQTATGTISRLPHNSNGRSSDGGATSRETGRAQPYEGGPSGATETPVIPLDSLDCSSQSTSPCLNGVKVEEEGQKPENNNQKLDRVEVSAGQQLHDNQSDCAMHVSASTNGKDDPLRPSFIPNEATNGQEACNFHRQRNGANGNNTVPNQNSNSSEPSRKKLATKTTHEELRVEKSPRIEMDEQSAERPSRQATPTVEKSPRIEMNEQSTERPSRRLQSVAANHDASGAMEDDISTGTADSEIRTQDHGRTENEGMDTRNDENEEHSDGEGSAETPDESADAGSNGNSNSWIPGFFSQHAVSQLLLAQESDDDTEAEAKDVEQGTEAPPSLGNNSVENEGNQQSPALRGMTKLQRSKALKKGHYNLNIMSMVVEAAAATKVSASKESTFQIETRVKFPAEDGNHTYCHRCGIQWYKKGGNDPPRVHWPDSSFELWRSEDKPFSSFVCRSSGYRWFDSVFEAKMYACLSFLFKHSEQFGPSPALKRFLEIPDIGEEQDKTDTKDNIASYGIFVLPKNFLFAVGVRSVDGSIGYFLLDQHQHKASDIYYRNPMKFAKRHGVKSKGQMLYRGIVNHFGPLHAKASDYKGSVYNVLVRWANGNLSHEPLDNFSKYARDACYEYAEENGLLDTVGWTFLKARRQSQSPKFQKKKRRHEGCSKEPKRPKKRQRTQSIGERTAETECSKQSHVSW